MAHAHHHHGESKRDYFVEQLLTIFVVGMFGFAAIRLYQTGMLEFVLSKPFQLPVFVAGVAVLVLVAVRAVSVWQEAGEATAAGHDHAHHEHGPDCDHGHDHHHHDDGHDHHDHSAEGHGHSHDLTWTFARMLVLFFPVALFLVGVPSAGYSQEAIKRMLGHDEQIDADFGYVAPKEGGAVMSFNDLNESAYDAGKRQALEGQVVVLTGRFNRVGEKQFTLYKLKRTCCSTDAVPLKVRIVTPTALRAIPDGEWVRVKGQVRFATAPNGQVIPVLAVADMGDIQKTAPESEYE